MAEAPLLLCCEELLHIASFLTTEQEVSDSFSADQAPPGPINNNNHNVNVNDPETEYFDSDKEERLSFGDLDAEEEDANAQGVDVEDGGAFDDFMEARRARQHDRYYRREVFAKRLREKKKRAEKLELEKRSNHQKVKEEAWSIAAISGVCSVWRHELCRKSSDANILLWKPLFQNLFPIGVDSNVTYNDCSRRVAAKATVLENRGYSYFEMFQLMIKIRNLQKNLNGKQTEITSASNKDIKDVHEPMVFMEFRYKAKYRDRHYMGIGEVDDHEVLNVYIPNFDKLCESKKWKWWKDAHNSCDKRSKKKRSSSKLYHYGWDGNCMNDSGEEDGYHSDFSSYWEDEGNDLIWSASNERCCLFPEAHIILIQYEESKNAFHVSQVYRGKPKWKGKREDDNNFGPEEVNYEETPVAHLFGNKYLACIQKNNITVAHLEPNAPYSEEQKEEWDFTDLNEEECKEGREKDVREFMLRKD